MRPLSLILCLSLLFAAFTPGRWADAESISKCAPALHAAKDALPPCADAGRGNELHRWWIGAMKVRISQHADLELPLELRMRHLPDPGKNIHGSLPPTLLTEHVRQQV